MSVDLEAQVCTPVCKMSQLVHCHLQGSLPHALWASAHPPSAWKVHVGTANAGEEGNAKQEPSFNVISTLDYGKSITMQQ